MSKVLVFDLDGTLLRTDKTVSDRTINTIKRCERLENHIIIATARPPRNAKWLIPDKLKSEYIIYYNGAEIYHNGSLIYKKTISEPSARSIIKFMESYCPRAVVSIEVNNKLYSNYATETLVRVTEDNIVNFNEFEIKPPSKVLIELARVKDINPVCEQIPKDCSMVITDGGKIMQIMSQGVSKLAGIKTVLAKLNKDIKDVISFGDDFNDLEILQESGIGVAMGNAAPELKKVADFITLSNDDDGIADYLEKEFLPKRDTFKINIVPQSRDRFTF